MGVALLAKETLGLAAEYAVASELCRRGIYAQLTLGNRKRTDLLVDVEGGRMLRVQVKAKQQREWPGVKGVAGTGIVLVFVDYEKKALVDRPDFYVLTPVDWKAMIDAELISSGKLESGQVALDDALVPTWKDGFVGMSIRPEQIRMHQEAWGRVSELLGIAP